ncbi:MAG: thioredoxin domain-containing protein [Saprospiraceae bacterium]
MKNILIVLITLLWSFGAWAQEGGIQFHKDAKWADLLAKAKTENKLIFLDAYATWCGPCKWMDSYVFKNEEVGNFYNANFINAKIDMEKGEGLELAKRYSVEAYPTILYVDGNGAVMHRVVGSKEAEAFLETGRTALDPNKRLASLEKRFDAGDRDPAFIAMLMTAFSESMHPRAAEVTEFYLDSKPTNVSPENMMLILNNVSGTDSKGFKFVLENRAKIEKEFGVQSFMNVVQQAILTEAFPNAQLGEMPSMEEIKKAYQAKLEPALAAQAIAYFEMNLYRAQQDNENFGKKAVEYYKKYPSNDWGELNTLAWSFYEQVDDKKLLKEALKWAQQSVKLESNFYNNDTLAALYFKTGDKKNAKKYAEKALELAKEAGEDPSATEELLMEIKKMK